jgi:mannose-6-phosphate isomerase-like protein (cupin superfamily)
MINDLPLSAAPLNSGIFDWAKIAPVPTKVGECRNFFDSPTRTFARMECHATTLRGGERAHEAHRHADEEMIFLKEGQLEVTINDRVEQAAAGAVLFFASMDLHGLRNAGTGPATYYVLRIFPRDLAAT